MRIARDDLRASLSVSTAPWSSTAKDDPIRRTIACMVCSMMTMVMPSSAQRRTHGDNIFGLGLSETGERFVEQQQLRPARERAGQSPSGAVPWS